MAATSLEIRSDDGRGRIEVGSTDEPTRVQFSVRCGHLAIGRRQVLVEKVFAQPDVAEAEWVEVSVPLGDVELLWAVEQHLEDPTTRAAGATCLLSGRPRGAAAVAV